MIKSYPKILAIGSVTIPDLLDGNVEVTEKIDGSSFAFGFSETGELEMRSKGRMIIPDVPDKMFNKAVNWVTSNKEKIALSMSNGDILYAEYLNSPRHNTLTYNRTPENNLMAFALLRNSFGRNGFVDHDELSAVSKALGIEVVPKLGLGKFTVEDLKAMMDRESCLGGPKMEGIVLKDYTRMHILGGEATPYLAKFVSEAFKEVHVKNWKENQTVGGVDSFIESFRTEARWHKAIQHLRDNGQLVGDLKDIGPLMKEIEADIKLEESANIKEKLYDLYIDSIIRKARAGFPEFYKEELMKKL